nr:mitofilin family membrane protein [Sagittula marina]
MTALEKQPLAESVSPEAIAAYERELEQLRGAVSDQQTALEAEKAALNEQLEQRTAEMQSIVDEARALETSAEDQARLAAARAAVSDVIARIQEGQAFAEPLAALSDNDVTVPDALQATAEDGVPTMASLSGSFPDAARQALAASRSSAAPEGEADAATSGGLGAFFQSQLGARSVVPKEGNSTDAILSRAEDAVRNSNLDKALTELEALPTEAKDALSDWLSQAELRRDALAQASDLAQQLNQQ